MSAFTEPAYLGESVDHAARVPPHSSEAEQSVLGGLLIDNSAWERVSDQISESDFYRFENRETYAAISALIGAGKPADGITVFERLQSAGKADACGGLSYLSALAQAVPTAANIRHYAARVREHAIGRSLIQAGGEVAAMGWATDVPIADRLDKALAMITALATKRPGSRDPMSIEEATAELLDFVQDQADGKNPAISTGLSNLDRPTAGGIRRGELWIIGARPKMGKTAMALAVQRAMSAGALGTLYLSQEMPVRELMMRHVAAIGGIGLAELRAPKPHDDDMWHRLVEALDAIRRLRMFHDTQGGLSLHDVRRKVMHTRRRTDLAVVFVDYLQLMVGQGANRNAELDPIVNGLKAMALEFNVGVVLMSQLNRKADDRNGPPVMSDLRDCGAIEAAGDLIAMLYRESFRNPTEENRHHAQLEIVAQRNGPAGTVHLRFDGALQRFGDWPAGEPLPSGRAARASVPAGGVE